MRISEISEINRLIPILKNIEIDLDSFYEEIINLFEIFQDLGPYSHIATFLKTKKNLISLTMDLKNKISEFDTIEFYDNTDSQIEKYRKKHQTMSNRLDEILEILD